MAMNRKDRRTAAKQARSSDVKGASLEAIDLMTDRALALANAEKWDEAERILRQIVVAHPNNAESNHLLGISLGRLGRAVEGIEYLRKATDLKPAEALYWNNLAVCMIGAARHRDAAEAARRAATIDPNYSLAWDSLGDALTATQDFAEAEAAYGRSIALKGPDPTTLKRLANCQMNIGDLAGAEAGLKRVLEFDPDDMDATSNLGTVFVAMKRYDEALPYLEKAAGKKGDQFSIAYNYARALADTGQSDKAVRWFRRATSIDHRNPGPWMHLGEILLRSGELDEAIQAAKRAFELTSGAEAPRELLNRIEAVRKPATMAISTAKKEAPVMWDFHLGEGAPAQPTATGGLDVTFTSEKMNGNAASPKPAVAKPSSTQQGIVDLTILKIGK
jgi:Flp pilus assembly protein TadD